MYGREATRAQSSNQVAPTPQTRGAIPNRNLAGKNDAEDRTALWFPWVLLLAVALYFVWAVLEQHEKIKTAIKPQAIGINLRNLAIILATVVLGLNLFKIAAAKYSAFTGGRFGGRLVVWLAGGA